MDSGFNAYISTNHLCFCNLSSHIPCPCTWTNESKLSTYHGSWWIIIKAGRLLALMWNSSSDCLKLETPWFSHLCWDRWLKFSYHIHKQFSWDELRLVDVDLEPTRVKVDHGYMCGNVCLVGNLCSCAHIFKSLIFNHVGCVCALSHWICCVFLVKMTHYRCIFRAFS